MNDKPQIFMGRCRRLRRCGYIDCLCDIDPTDPRAVVEFLKKEKRGEAREETTKSE